MPVGPGRYPIESDLAVAPGGVGAPRPSGPPGRQPSRPRRAALVAVAVSVLLALAACADTGGAATADALSDDDRPVDRAATLTLAQFSQPPVFDPPRTRVVGDPSYYTLVYDQLLGLDQDLNVAPRLASAFEMSPDGRALTLTLRDAVRFQDGSTLDSSVVVANLERARTLAQSVVAPLLADVVAVEAPDRSTVRVQFSTPHHSFPYTLATNPNLSSVISGQALAAGADLTREPAGSGPYRLAELLPDRATFTRDDDYWDAAALPTAATVTIIGIPDDAARLSALQSGQVDLATANPQRAPDYEGQVAAGTLRETSFAGQIFTLFLNTGSPELADPRVRTALTMAIDRTTINDALLAGTSRPAFQMFPEGVAGHLPEADADPYDPERARALLAEAGLPNPTLDIVLTSTEPGDSLATVLQSQLAEVGVTLNLQRFQPTTASAAWYTGDHDGIMATIRVAGDPTTAVDYALLGPINPGGLSPRLEAAITAAYDVPLADPGRPGRFEDLTRLLEDEPQHLLLLQAPLVYLTVPDLLFADQMIPAQFGATLDARVLARAAG